MFHNTISISLRLGKVYNPLSNWSIILCYSEVFLIGVFMFAHYFADGGNRVLIISTSPKPVGFKIPVGSLAEAEAYASQYGAKRWNF